MPKEKKPPRRDRGMKVSVYVRDGAVNGSHYYRVIQYLREFRRLSVRYRRATPGWFVKRLYKASGASKQILLLAYYLNLYLSGLRFLVADALKRPDVVIISRAAFPKVCGFFPVAWLYRRLLTGAEVVWDFDDDIFCCNEITPLERGLLQRHSDAIVVTHEELANLLDPDERGKVIILPTTDRELLVDDLALANSKRRETYQSGIVLAWVGTDITQVERVIPYLDGAARAVREALGKQLRLVCICNRALDAKVEHLAVENVEWRRDKVKELLEEAHIGIMPLRNDAFSRGKGAFKVIQYMSSGLPSIASAIGFNAQVVRSCVNGYLVEDTSDAWASAILELSRDWETWVRMSGAALKSWHDEFSFDNNLHCWMGIVKADRFGSRET